MFTQTLHDILTQVSALPPDSSLPTSTLAPEPSPPLPPPPHFDSSNPRSWIALSAFIFTVACIVFSPSLPIPNLVPLFRFLLKKIRGGSSSTTVVTSKQSPVTINTNAKEHEIVPAPQAATECADQSKSHEGSIISDPIELQTISIESIGTNVVTTDSNLPSHSDPHFRFEEQQQQQQKQQQQQQQQHHQQQQKEVNKDLTNKRVFSANAEPITIIKKLIQLKKVISPYIYWIRIDFGVAPLLGLILLYITTSLEWHNIIGGIVGNEHIKPYSVLLLFMSLSYVCISLDKTGMFEYLAKMIIIKCNNSGLKLYFSFCAFASILTVFTSNDIVILTLTPIICYMSLQTSNLNPIPYVVSQFFLANVWSMCLQIGNPTNIIVAEATRLNFLSYSKWMLLPAFTAGITCQVLLFLLFRKRIPSVVLPKAEEEEALLGGVDPPSTSSMKVEEVQQQKQTNDPKDEKHDVKDDKHDLKGDIDNKNVQLDYDNEAVHIPPSKTLEDLIEAQQITTQEDFKHDIQSNEYQYTSISMQETHEEQSVQKKQSQEVTSTQHLNNQEGKQSFDTPRLKYRASALLKCSLLLLCLLALSISSLISIGEFTISMWMITVFFFLVFLLLDIVTDFYCICSSGIKKKYHQNVPTQSTLPIRETPRDFILKLSKESMVWNVLKRMPWKIVPFAFGMFIMVEVLKHYGFVSLTARSLSWFINILAGGETEEITFWSELRAVSSAVLVMTYTSSMACNLLNNQPMTILFTDILKNVHFSLSGTPKMKLGVQFGLIMGSNLGANITLIGALAGILWISILKQFFDTSILNNNSIISKLGNTREIHDKEHHHQHLDQNHLNDDNENNKHQRSVIHEMSMHDDIHGNNDMRKMDDAMTSSSHEEVHERRRPRLQMNFFVFFKYGILVTPIVILSSSLVLIAELLIF